jgi:hypothetical protein
VHNRISTKFFRQVLAGIKFKKMFGMYSIWPYESTSGYKIWKALREQDGAYHVCTLQYQISTPSQARIWD